MLLLFPSQIHQFIVRITIGWHAIPKPTHGPHIATETTSSIPAVESAQFRLLNLRSLVNNSLIYRDFIIQSNSIDFFLSSQPWINPDKHCPTIEPSRPELIFFHSQGRPVVGVGVGLGLQWYKEMILAALQSRFNVSPLLQFFALF